MTTYETIILEGTAYPDQIKTYPLLPFEMPPNTVRIDVAYEYSSAIGSDPHLSGGNTVDIGIFDPRGSDFLGDGFRGWSGSARSEFFIAEDEATPGYMPGLLQVGTWHICLGLYKIAENGCDYRVTITLTLNEKATEAAFPNRLELSPRPRPDIKNESGWYRGEFHCHTHHSDGDSSPVEVVKLAESLGLDFLAITDHNVLSQQVSLRTVDTPLMLIPGMEVTTFKGHWNIWGTGDWVDFRVTSKNEMQQAVNTALEQGYLISCNHPKPYGPEWEYPDIKGFNCIEVWNGPWHGFNDIALKYWEEKLRSGERYSAIGGSDNHFLKREHHAKLGHPTTYIYIEGDPSPRAILEAVRLGHAFITEAPNGPKLFLETETAMMGDTASPSESNLLVTVRVNDAPKMKLEICGATGIVHQLSNAKSDWETSLRIDVSYTSYVRAQLVTEEDDSRRIHALTNPIYIQ